MLKLTLFLLYVQLFRPLRWLRILSYIGAIVSGMFYVSLSIVYAALCAPRDGQSTIAYFSALTSRRCSHGQDSVVILLGVVNLASDLYLLVLPLPAVWKLHLALRRKLAILTMFLTGAM